MPTISFSLQSAQNGSGDWLPIVIPVWLLIWLATLVLVLKRPDYDPVTRLTWVIVVIFIPFFGIPLYWFIAPDARGRTIEPGETSGTPWRNNPSHKLRQE